MKRLLNATTIVVVSTLLLAACGGGSNDDSEPTQSMPTSEEACADMGQGYAIDSDGECKSLDDAHAEGVEEGEKNVKDNSGLAKAMADAKALLAVLNSDGDADASPVVPDPSQINPAAATGITLYADAKDDMKGKMAVSVMGDKFSEAYAAGGSAVTGTAVASIGATGVLSFSTTPTADARIMASAFSTGGPKTHEKTSVRDGIIYFSAPGSYHGVAGTYECAGAADDACTSSVAPDDSGNVMLTGTWTFTAMNREARVTDSDGVEYGWWAVESGGSVTQAHVFFSVPTGGLVARDTLPADHGGKATYKGNALGHYAIHRGESGTNDSGNFQADAELTATFGASASIEGTIDNFMGSDGESRDWMVKLKKISSAPTSGLYSGMDNVVWTIGEDASADGGSWQVRAYGGGTSTATSGEPAAVAGGFSAEHGIMNAQMIGAFGADKQE